MDVSRQRYTRSVISVTADVRLSSCFHRVSTYIAEGRDDEIVDPDHGANISVKVEKLQKMGGTSVHPNLARVPKCPERTIQDGLATYASCRFSRSELCTGTLLNDPRKRWMMESMSVKVKVVWRWNP